MSALVTISTFTEFVKTAAATLTLTMRMSLSCCVHCGDRMLEFRDYRGVRALGCQTCDVASMLPEETHA